MEVFTRLFLNFLLFTWLFSVITCNEVHTSKGIEEAVALLAQSVTQLAQKVTTLENSFSRKLGSVQSAITSEKASTDELNQKLDKLSSVGSKLEKLDRKVSRETSIIKDSLTNTNLDMKLLSTKIEALEQSQKKFHSVLRSDNIKRKAKYHKGLHYSEEEENGSESPKRNITNMVAEGVEKVLPRILASELNLFYANIATKLDNALNQLHKDTLQRLRRVDEVSRNTLREVKDGRQDINHLTHIQRNLFSNISAGINVSTKNSFTNDSCIMDKNVISDFVKKIANPLESNICQLCNWRFWINSSNITNSNNSISLVKDIPKGGIVKAPINSPLWKQLFTTSLHPTEKTTSKQAKVNESPNITNTAMVDDVKDLLETLITNGEDLRRTVTEQASEGVDLLKHLHQRFSVLMRNMNNEPNHEEALLSEVKELEHLVENSYSSILHAQNLFIASCNRIQNNEPAFEEKIQEVLSKFLTSMELGHQFNQQQLSEMKTLIEELLINSPSRRHSEMITDAGSFLSSFIEHTNISEGHNYSLDFQQIITEIESNDILLQSAIEKIQEAEKEFQDVDWKSAKLKNQSDQLLTSAKDIKGLSKLQSLSRKTLQEKVNKIVDDIVRQKRLLDQQINVSVDVENSSEDVIFNIPKVCAVSLVTQLKSHDLSFNSSFYFKHNRDFDYNTIHSKDKHNADHSISRSNSTFELPSNFSNFNEYLQDEFDDYYNDYDYRSDDKMRKFITYIEV